MAETSAPIVDEAAVTVLAMLADGVGIAGEAEIGADMGAAVTTAEVVCALATVVVVPVVGLIGADTI